MRNCGSVYIIIRKVISINQSSTPKKPKKEIIDEDSLDSDDDSSDDSINSDESDLKKNYTTPQKKKIKNNRLYLNTRWI